MNFSIQRIIRNKMQSISKDRSASWRCQVLFVCLFFKYCKYAFPKWVWVARLSKTHDRHTVCMREKKAEDTTNRRRNRLGNSLPVFLTASPPLQTARPKYFAEGRPCQTAKFPSLVARGSVCCNQQLQAATLLLGWPIWCWCSCFKTGLETDVLL